MLLKIEKYRLMIQKVTQTTILFRNQDNEQKKPIITQQYDIKLPSLHLFRSSQQIEHNIPTINSIIDQISKQCPKSLNSKWPHSCLGLVLCEHQQNNQTFYVYGTGILIKNSIVLTSAQNVYCRRFHIEYVNIRFITGVNGSKCSGIYIIKRVHYPKKYTIQEYENYDFAVLQLQDDLSDIYGYIALKTSHNINQDKEFVIYGYMRDDKTGSFKLQQIEKHEKLEENQQVSSGSGVLMKEQQNKYYIVGLISSRSQGRGYSILSERIRNIINQWTFFITIKLGYKNIGLQGCKYISQTNWAHSIAINLTRNKIGSQGCKYLSQVNWKYINMIDLNQNDIGSNGCKQLCQAKWIHLTIIKLYKNNIGTQGCKYLSQSNWPKLKTIDLIMNHIDAQGCKYLSQANWKHLTEINLNQNHIKGQSCKYLSQTNWVSLTKLDLKFNNLKNDINLILLKQLWPNVWIYI